MIKVKFTDGFPDTIRQKTLCILEEHFGQVSECENPDFLFYSVWGYEHLKYQCVRIFWTGENLQPDFNICDYAIGFGYMTFEDRYTRIPLYFFYDWDYELAKNKHLLTQQDIEDKTEFCNFIYSNDNASHERIDFFHILSKYKKVDSAGRYNNNIGYAIEGKHDFQKRYKFSIAFENSSTSGYTTEKIIQAFSAGTIPIYWGNPRIADEFNEKSFINCHKYSSFEEVVKRIMEIDKDDELFVSYLKAPIDAGTKLPDNPWEEYERFIVHICEQTPECAIRRNNIYWGADYQNNMLKCRTWQEEMKRKNRRLYMRIWNKLRRCCYGRKMDNNN